MTFVMEPSSFPFKAVTSAGFNWNVSRNALAISRRFSKALLEINFTLRNSTVDLRHKSFAFLAGVWSSD